MKLPNELVMGVIIKALLALLVSGALYSVYSHIKQSGVDEANIKCEQRYKEYENTIGKRIESIEKLSTTLVLDGKTSSAALATDVAKILKNTKTKPLTIIKNGECIPSKTFSDSISEVNDRVNKSLMESRK